jgi:hypothetical protein
MTERQYDLIAVYDRDGRHLGVLRAQEALRYDDEHDTTFAQGVVDAVGVDALVAFSKVTAWLVLGGGAE